MVSSKKLIPSKFLRGALASVFVASAMVTFAPDARADRPTVRVPPERAEGGTTIEEYSARQAQLHQSLTADRPAGALNAPLRVDINDQDRADLAVPPINGTTPLKIGVVKEVDAVRGQVFNRGDVQASEDGSSVWAITVTSPGAQAIRVHFKNFSLPANAAMYFYSQEGQVHGPYLGTGRNGTGEFWTRSINSDTGVIQLRFSDTDKGRISFIIADVGHIRGRPPQPVEQSHDSWPCSDNAPCVVDANCVNGTPAEDSKDAIARMEWIAGCCIYTCSGGLLADTDGSSQVPLFLTANHCTSKSISNMETYFNYTTDSCNGTCPDNYWGSNPPPPSTIGFTVVASGRKGDFTLGTLDQTPPAGAIFLGWTNAAIAFTDGADLHRISNPNYGPQGYSHHQVDSSAGTCRGWPRGERIYSTDITGATMGGSSGSPVVNAAGLVVGQLSGCCGFNCADECDTGSNSTVDGALAFYYDSVAPFLDPVGCTPSTEVCDDGADNDCDGDVDCADADCTGDPACTCTPTTEVCDDGADNDCDGDVDCADADCAADPACNCTGGQLGDPCVDDADCCSNKCKGKPGAKTCK